MPGRFARRRARPRWMAPIVGLAALILVPVLPAQESDPKPSAPRLTPAEAREVFSALREIVDSVRQEEASARARRRPIDRPEKQVTPPTLTPAELDRKIQAYLDGEQARPAPVVDDPTFLRRVSLDLTGKIPTPAELAEFSAETDPDKRARAIDRLLASDDYARHWSAYWLDVIRHRATFEQARLINYPSLETWLREQFAANRPWDEIATQLIAGTGRTDEAGQTAFAVAHLDGRAGVSAPEFAGEVSRIFLGVQIQCAQCHDHPTDPWKREEFHQFASFFAGTQGRRIGRPQDPDYGIEVISPARVPRYGMPGLEDPTQIIPVEPRFVFSASAETEQPYTGLTTAERRTLVASLITGQDNPWFAKAFINRLWYELMGDAFYMPIDDLGPTRDPVAPEVLETLASQWQQGGYDIQWLLRTILNTQAYQRQSRASGSQAAQTPFASNCPSRLRPDEIVNALTQALGVPAPMMNGPMANRRPAMAAAMPNAQAARLRARFNPAAAIALLFGADPSTPDDEVLGTIPQTLFLMNSQMVNGAISHPRGVLTGLLQQNDDDRGAIRALYARVLSRPPSDDELALCLEYIPTAENRRAAFEDLYWALVNSSEFISRR